MTATAKQLGYNYTEHNIPEHVQLERHVVLIAPEVHWNTGNIGRTCLGAEANLHLIKPLGFSLTSKQVKRAGLDYWHKVNLSVWDNFEHFYKTLQPDDNQLILFSKSGSNLHWQMPSLQRLFLLFGSETKGLPQDLLDRFSTHIYRIPISHQIRCLNLSTAVGIALYESLRLTNFQ
jgi:tRNA (cytidine/uridine-2'-O-)-methyltransferase